MAYNPSTDLQQVQSDILTQDTTSNILMPSNPLDFLNKALRTDQNNIIGAINDLNAMVSGLYDNFVNFGTKYNGIILDTDSLTGQNKLQEMQTLLGYSTLLEAVVELAKRNGGSSSGSGISIKDFKFDETTNILTLTLSDNTSYPIDLSNELNSKADKVDLEWGSF